MSTVNLRKHFTCCTTCLKPIAHLNKVDLEKAESSQNKHRKCLQLHDSIINGAECRVFVHNI